MNIGVLFLVLAGLFTIVGAVMDWDWFMMNRRARLFVSIFGRNGARVVYVLLGMFLMVMGILGGLGVISLD